jgi:hypothetical protein
MTDTDLNRQLVEAGSTAEMAEALRASGTVDELLAQIDTGEVVLTGDGGLLPGLIKLAASSLVGSGRIDQAVPA